MILIRYIKHGSRTRQVKNTTAWYSWIINFSLIELTKASELQKVFMKKDNSELCSFIVTSAYAMTSEVKISIKHITKATTVNCSMAISVFRNISIGFSLSSSCSFLSVFTPLYNYWISCLYCARLFWALVMSFLCTNSVNLLSWLVGGFRLPRLGWPGS